MHATNATNVTIPTILIVDDSVTSRNMIGLLLANYQLNLVYATNGQDAVTICKDPRSKIDFVLMDIHMPVMDGVDAMKAIRALPRGRTLPITALTANLNGDHDGQLYVSIGFTSFVAKPVEVQRLLLAINEHISLRVKKRTGYTSIISGD